MKFKGRNGGMALAIRNHIMLFRAFVITLLITLVPTIIFICINNSYFWVFLILPLMLLTLSYVVFFFSKYDDDEAIKAKEEANKKATEKEKE